MTLLSPGVALVVPMLFYVAIEAIGATGLYIDSTTIDRPPSAVSAEWQTRQVTPPEPASSPETKQTTGTTGAASGETSITVALITGVVSLIVSFVAGVASYRVAAYNARETRQAQADIEELKHDLRTQKSKDDARRDYEYEALKRLYEQLEPLIFQLTEVSESALRRVNNLARSSRYADLATDGRGWLRSEGYYFLSTLYRFIAPISLLRMMQVRLTLIDLTLEPRLRTLYELTKLLADSLSDEFRIATQEPKLEYDPDKGVSNAERARLEAIYWRQGIYAGSLEAAADALLVVHEYRPVRIRTFAEFGDAYADRDSALRASFAPVAEIFDGFTPGRRPVLWRVLIIQAHVYRAILRSQRITTWTSEAGRQLIELAAFDEQERAWFDWRYGQMDVPDEHVLVEPFRVAETYLKGQVASRSESR